ncbi:hypothetical protein [uncultured Fibrobacter sp.]|uniref:hypothetical protein n=1 Tax=uncultured Fibrobacter sp. TaxID=261512 RepID=UPI0025D51AE7|nr:hypothetical protein [uncultured Fibrobacter sp.]
MNEIDFTQVYTSIGNAVGVPAAIAFFWVVSRIKELTTKVKILEKENSTFKQTLSDIRADVSFIRGKLEQ